MKKILIIQTAFIGDVILSTAIAKKIHQSGTNFKISYLVRKGNESLINRLPYIEHVFIWDKKTRKYANLFKIIKAIRNEQFDLVINLQRFFATGLITALSKAKQKAGFRKNPLSVFFDVKKDHVIGNNIHEVDRNQALIAHITDNVAERPELLIDEKVIEEVKPFTGTDYITIAPASVWFTKQFPKDKWAGFLDNVPRKFNVYIIGSPDDSELAEEIISKTENNNVKNLCGTISLNGSAGLMKSATMNYVNDSAPLHLASATNAPVRAIFCSTVPAFGFGPLSDNSRVIETAEDLDCRPCGLHGKKACPLGTFECATTIDTKTMANELIN